MPYINPQPPYCNGVMELTEQQAASIKAELEEIREAHVPSYDYPEASMFYLTATFNKSNPEAPINQDTAEHLLNPPAEDPAAEQKTE